MVEYDGYGPDSEWQFAEQVSPRVGGRHDVVGRRWACLEDGVEQPPVDGSWQALGAQTHKERGNEESV